MNNIDKSIFNSYASAEAALLNVLATETKTKGKKARTLKGEKYYVKYDGVWYPVTPEQCQIYKLIKNNYNMFVEQLNSAKSDILGVWKNVWQERLPRIIADLEKGIEICQKYFDAFKEFIIEDVKENVEEETSEESEVDATEKVTKEVSDEKTDESEVEKDGFVSKMGTKGQDRDAEGFVCKTQTNTTSRTAPRTTKTAPHDGSSRTTKTARGMPEFRV